LTDAARVAVKIAGRGKETALQPNKKTFEGRRLPRRAAHARATTYEQLRIRRVNFHERKWVRFHERRGNLIAATIPISWRPVWHRLVDLFCSCHGRAVTVKH
jgi:hypothetical protein